MSKCRLSCHCIRKCIRARPRRHDLMAARRPAQVRSQDAEATQTGRRGSRNAARPETGAMRSSLPSFPRRSPECRSTSPDPPFATVPSEAGTASRCVVRVRVTQKRPLVRHFSSVRLGCCEAKGGRLRGARLQTMKKRTMRFDGKLCTVLFKCGRFAALSHFVTALNH